MTLDTILVLLFSIGGIVFTYWFFLMKKEELVSVEESVEIVVDGGYKPNSIAISKGRETTITFLRRDPSSCLEEVVLSDFGIRKFLPMHQKISVTIMPEKEGVYPFSCGMNMFHGKIMVKQDG